jgi:hypothetical protein
MDTRNFERLFSEFEKSAFRLETLPRYEIPLEAEMLREYEEGALTPGADLMSPWCEVISTAVRAGKQMTRVRLLPQPLTLYVKCGIDWAYPRSYAAGEKVLFLVPDQVPPAILALSDHDFWLFDDTTLVLMEYGARGEFLGPRFAPSSAVDSHRRIRDAVLSHAIDFRAFLRRFRRGEVV